MYAQASLTAFGAASWCSNLATRAPWRRLVSWLAVLGFAAAPSHSSVRLDAGSEDDVRAAFVYRLLKFVEWPAPSHAAPRGPLRFCVCASDRMFTALSRVSQGQRVQDRPVAVRKVDLDALGDCDAVFVGTRMTAPFLSRRRAFESHPLLTIGEAPGFARAGGMVNLVLDDQHLRFEVNRRVLRHAGLDVSALVLSLAIIIE